MSGPAQTEIAPGSPSVASDAFNMSSAASPNSPGLMQKFKPSNNVLRQVAIMLVTLVAIFQAGRSIVGSVQRQCYLHKQSNVLKDGQHQAEEINKELRDGLTSYRSSTGIERLARERLNLAGPDEVVIRIGK